MSSDDLVQRLRDPGSLVTREEAADRIEAQAAEIARLRQAVFDAHGFLSGEFYAEALGVLEDALEIIASATDAKP